MVFSSPEFLFAFFPIAFILILTTQKRVYVQNAVIAAISLVFYSWGNPSIALLLLVSVFANYFLALCFKPADASGDKPFARIFGNRRVIVVICVVFNILLLCIFKYANFIIGNLNLIPGLTLPKPYIALPIGISFFTFQGLSYVLDVGAGRIKAETDPVAMLLYVSLFPVLIAGPIVRYGDIEPMLRERTMTIRDTAYGLRRFICGLSKKVLIADVLGVIADAVFGSAAGATTPIACPVAWLGAIAYALQIYYDFSGYSDMAIGLCGIFGFRINENFDYPYAAVGLRDFWRKWHISLSTWFKDYLYIPLGGNRRGKTREALNKCAVFLLTGLWHGANWTFAVWGLFHGLFLSLETYGVIKPRKMPRAIAWLYTMLVVIAGFVIFRAYTLADAGLILSSMFVGAGRLIAFAFVAAGSAISAFGGTSVASVSATSTIGGAAGATGAMAGLSVASQFAQALSLLNPSVIPVFAVALAAMFPIKRLLLSKSQKYQAVGFIFSIPLLILCALNLSTATYIPFIYYRF